MALMQVLKTYYNDAQMTDTNSLVNALMERKHKRSNHKLASWSLNH